MHLTTAVLHKRPQKGGGVIVAKKNRRMDLAKILEFKFQRRVLVARRANVRFQVKEFSTHPKRLCHVAAVVQKQSRLRLICDSSMCSGSIVLYWRGCGDSVAL